MEELAKTFVGTKMDLNEANFKLDGTWKFDTVDSAATLVDAKDYYTVAKRAYTTAVNSK